MAPSDRPNVARLVGITGFSTWSLSKLRDHLLDRGTVAAIISEGLRLIMHTGGVSLQSASTRNPFH